MNALIGERFWDKENRTEIRLYTVKDVRDRFPDALFSQLDPLVDIAYNLIGEDGEFYCCWYYDNHPKESDDCACPLKDVARYSLWDGTEDMHEVFFEYLAEKRRG